MNLSNALLLATATASLAMVAVPTDAQSTDGQATLWFGGRLSYRLPPRPAVTGEKRTSGPPPPPAKNPAFLPPNHQATLWFGKLPYKLPPLQ
ncbi:hypothetical protein GGF32_002672 [Allomyces javanicus]|nr:hypothetical protein GGF32_002672 [Allomyces javanicus]